MKLNASNAVEHLNIPVIRRVLEEFDGENVVELNRRMSCVFLIWNSTSNGDDRSLSMAIPRTWLTDPQCASHLEQRTRNFAGRIIEAL